MNFRAAVNFRVKPAEYAEAGIPHFWRIEFDSQGIPAAFRYRLDPAASVYAAAETTATSRISIADPSSSPWTSPT